MDVKIAADWRGRPHHDQGFPTLWRAAGRWDRPIRAEAHLPDGREGMVRMGIGAGQANQLIQGQVMYFSNNIWQSPQRPTIIPRPASAALPGCPHQIGHRKNLRRDAYLIGPPEREEPLALAIGRAHMTHVTSPASSAKPEARD